MSLEGESTLNGIDKTFISHYPVDLKKQDSDDVISKIVGDSNNQFFVNGPLFFINYCAQ